MNIIDAAVPFAAEMAIRDQNRPFITSRMKNVTETLW